MGPLRLNIDTHVYFMDQTQTPDRFIAHINVFKAMYCLEMFNIV